MPTKTAAQVAFVPLPDPIFPPLTPEFRAALRTQRELEGVISGLTKRQGEVTDRIRRIDDSLRSMVPRLKLAHETALIAEAQGDTTRKAAAELAKLQDEDESLRGERQALQAEMDSRQAFLDKMQAELAKHAIGIASPLERAAREWRAKCLDENERELTELRNQIRAIIAYRGALSRTAANVRHHNFWPEFNKWTVGELFVSIDEKARELDAYIANCDVSCDE